MTEVHSGRPRLPSVGAASRHKWGAILLIAPLAGFLLIVYAIPLYEILARGIVDDELSSTWPRVSEALADWNGQVPNDDVFAALAADMKASQKDRTTAIA